MIGPASPASRIGKPNGQDRVSHSRVIIDVEAKGVKDCAASLEPDTGPNHADPAGDAGRLESPDAGGGDLARGDHHFVDPLLREEILETFEVAEHRHPVDPDAHLRRGRRR